MGLSNAERQERWRIKRAKEVEELRKAAAKAERASKAAPASQELAEARKEIKRLTAELAAARATKPAKAASSDDVDAATLPLVTEIALLRQQVVLLKGARQEPAKAKPRPVERLTPAQVKVGRLENGHVTAKWLPGHKDKVIEVSAYQFFTGDPLGPVEQMLAELPGVYRIARIVGGSFGSEGKQSDDLRPQARALVAVTERALKAEATPGGWCGGVVVYDPREPQ